MSKYIVCFLLFLVLLSCNQDKIELPKPNIVWITSEDNSKHYLKLFDDNGVATPNIESLAEHGIVFSRAFSNAPVCSVARSAIISGCYGPRIGAQYHRKMEIVPMPDSLHMFPTYLRQRGYYTTNNRKEDYNIIKDDAVWDESSKDASWRNREEGQPFFHVFNIGISHESGLHFSPKQMDSITTETDLNTFEVQPNHPQTKLFKYTNAFYRDKIKAMDRQVGMVLKELEKDGLREDTFIFYYGDHGGVLPGSKGYIYETGLHVPLVVHVPEKYKHLVDIEIGSVFNGFVNFIDLGPTVLNLAGIQLPEGMDGRPFMGINTNNKELNERDETFSYADRFDEKYDQVRAIRKGNYKYIRSYQPYNFDGLMNNYRYKQLAYQEWQSLYEEGKLNEVQSFFFEKREPEMLFDIETDPYETRNLIGNPEYADISQNMREKLNGWVKGMPDLSFFPEHFLIENAIDNPVEFGRLNKAKINKYIDISNLCLSEFDDARQELSNSLNSEDPWERYWGVIACTVFGEAAAPLQSAIQTIALNDPENLNRVRAAEYIGITKLGNPSEIMASALHSSKKPAEALLILNSIVLMQSTKHGYTFNLQLEKMTKSVAEHPQIIRRLEFLNVL